MHKVKEIVSIIKGLLGKLSQKIKPCLPYIYKVGNLLKKISPTRYLGILDWYIIKKFIGTYIYAILLIISIAIVFDFNENLSKFTQYHAPWRAIIFDYYANFIPYYSNLFSPLFVFIAVIFFTSKLAGNSISIALSSPMALLSDRTLKPYIVIRRRIHLRRTSNYLQLRTPLLISRIMTINTSVVMAFRLLRSKTRRL